MKIGIDISQLAYEHTGVANYLRSLVEHLVKNDTTNEYVLFFSSLRRPVPLLDIVGGAKVTVRAFKFPPTLLALIWNRLHVMPIEQLIGNVDIFITSDWTEPPTKRAKKATVLYDVIVYKYPEETAKEIVKIQKQKLTWVKKESAKILCISEATKKDAMDILGIEEKRLAVVYPGIF